MAFGDHSVGPESENAEVPHSLDVLDIDVCA